MRIKSVWEDTSPTLTVVVIRSCVEREKRRGRRFYRCSSSNVSESPARFTPIGKTTNEDPPPAAAAEM
jgi:hypothetical protein